MYNLQIYKLTNLQIMRKYIMPQVEVLNVKASCDLLAGSPAPVGNVYLPVAHGATDVTAE